MMQSHSSQTNRIFVISAPSGAGKTSLCSDALEHVPNLHLSVSHTTRSPRQGEQNGKNYYFISKEEFERAIRDGQMAEWTEIYGNMYGTAKSTIESHFDQGHDILFDVDERGARQLQNHYDRIITILILPPSLAVLKQRLSERGTESAEALSQRLNRAKEEIHNMRWYDYVIINDDFSKAAAELRAVIVAGRCRNNHRHIEQVLKNSDE